jgi:hypothetical protein
MTNATTTAQQRAAIARAGKARKYQERLAEKLKEAGWTVVPPTQVKSGK